MNKEYADTWPVCLEVEDESVMIRARRAVFISRTLQDAAHRTYILHNNNTSQS